MPDGLTPARLRALIAAATPGPWFGQYEYDGSRTVCQMRSCDETFCVNMASHVDGEPYKDTKANAELITTLVNNAPALADDMEKARLLEWALANGLYRCEFGVGYVAVDSIEALRAAKEAAEKSS